MGVSSLETSETEFCNISASSITSSAQSKLDPDIVADLVEECWSWDIFA